MSKSAPKQIRKGLVKTPLPQSKPIDDIDAAIAMQLLDDLNNHERLVNHKRAVYAAHARKVALSHGVTESDWAAGKWEVRFGEKMIVPINRQVN